MNLLRADTILVLILCTVELWGVAMGTLSKSDKGKKKKKKNDQVYYHLLLCMSVIILQIKKSTVQCSYWQWHDTSAYIILFSPFWSLFSLSLSLSVCLFFVSLCCCLSLSVCLCLSVFLSLFKYYSCSFLHQALSVLQAL